MVSDATRLLHRLAEGDLAAGDGLLPLVHAELKGLAERHMAGERSSHTLQATALVHEAWIRLLGTDGSAGSAGFEGRAHFLRAASRVMRRVLVDHARSRNSSKRAGGHQVPMDQLALAFEEGTGDLVDLDEALVDLGEEDPELAELVELRFFGGASMEEAARAAGVSLTTAERRWRIARAWLASRLGQAP